MSMSAARFDGKVYCCLEAVRRDLHLARNGAELDVILRNAAKTADISKLKVTVVEDHPREAAVR